MTDFIMTPHTKEIVSRLYSSNEYNKREAIYRILFDRRADLIPELKKAVKYEKNEQIAVFMVQVCITLSSFPRNSATEKRILEIISYDKDGGVNSLSPNMWRYLENCATSQMIIAILGAMGNSIPSNGFGFIEMCLTHPDPDVRAFVCEKAIRSGRPTHFAYVLNLITDKDPIVSETAFAAIKNLPENELSIILDYALGSPDEWVLNTVAPFLPNLVTQNLRGIILKVQYHSNHNVAIKAREALKILDAIPYSSKHTSQIQAEKQKKEEELKKQEQQKEEELKISLKEQMEQKRREKEEEERKKREAEEALDKELAAMSDEEIEDFEKEMANYDSVLPSSDKISINLDDNILPDQKEFLKDTDFSDEANNLLQIDDNNANINFEAEMTSEPASISTEKITPEHIEKAHDNQNSEQTVTPTLDTLDFATIAENLSSSSTEDETIIKKTQNDTKPLSPSEAKESDIPENVDFSNFDLSAAAETVDFSEAETKAQESVKESNLNFNDDLSELLTEENINLEVTNENDVKNIPSVDKPQITTHTLNKTEQKQSESLSNQPENYKALPNKTLNKEETIKQPQPKTASPQKQPQIENKTVAVTVPVAAKEIFAKYPSFITDPLLEVFKAKNNQDKLKAIEIVLDNLTAFLNLCFLQSAMYYAQESDMLNKSIKDCIKGNLIGPSSIRCLHNFILAMKTVRGNPVFFTFPLSKAMSDSSDTNPLMLMRELKDFLREPEEPLDENIPQAIDGLLEILRGVRSITNNTIIMKAPAGAKHPYADLTGPTADVLSADKRPSIDLPVGEVVVTSKDGTEAFGLFPFFKYSKKKIVFNKPNHEELKTFYERLEITP